MEKEEAERVKFRDGSISEALRTITGDRRRVDSDRGEVESGRESSSDLFEDDAWTKAQLS